MSSFRTTVDYSLYYVTGRFALPEGMDYYESLERACQGGVGIVQIREKNLSTREFLEIGRRSKIITDKFNIPLLINDRLDIALAVGCGLHVGQGDMPAALVRKLLGNDVIIGVSVNSEAEIKEVIAEGIADYVGIGPVLFTASKDKLSPILGPRGIRNILQILGHSAIKSVAIGGIGPTTIVNLLRQCSAPLSDGSYRTLDGVAVISAIAGSLTPELAAAQLKSFYVARPTPLALLAPTFSHSQILDVACSLLIKLRTDRTPLVHSITNYVVMNDSANLTLALGASPIMSASPEEADELGLVVSSLLINLGTLSTEQSLVHRVAGKAANRNGKPVVFDPVGVGATAFRKEAAESLMNDVHLDIIKGNAGEIGRLAGSEEAKALGVDSVGSFKDPGEVVKGLARKEKLVVAMSGVVDYVSDGKTIVSIQNGHHYQGSITGSGCMATTSIAVLASVAEKNEYFIAAVAGLLAINVAAEIAGQRADVKGPNTFRAALIDECYNLTPEVLREKAKFIVLSS